MTQPFPLAAILTITTGIVLTDFPQVHQLIEHMAGEPIWTHQIPRVAGECAPELRRQHPDLADIQPPAVFAGVGQVREWVAEQERGHGTHRDVAPLAAVDHPSISPLAEMSMNYPHVQVVPVVRDGETAP